jgi:hypothetical protein
MMTDDASGDGTDFTVPCEMARDTADDGAFDAPFRLGGDGSERHAQNDCTDDERLHGGSPKRTDCSNNPACGDWFRDVTFPRDKTTCTLDDVDIHDRDAPELS